MYGVYCSLSSIFRTRRGRSTLRSFCRVIDIEDITWPRGDTNFIFKILSALEDKSCIPKRPCNVLFILKVLMNSYIKHNFFFYSFSTQQNSAIKVVTYRKMPVTKML